MNREIIFRGKHIHALPGNEHLDGRWIEGYLCDKNYINSPELEGEFLIDENTISQYSGINDKNGKKIFDDDIIRIPDRGNYAVKFEYGQFCIGINLPLAYKRDECEVIGNIYDNPELLKNKI